MNEGWWKRSRLIYQATRLEWALGAGLLSRGLTYLLRLFLQASVSRSRRRPILRQRLSWLDYRWPDYHGYQVFIWLVLAGCWLRLHSDQRTGSTGDAARERSHLENTNDYHDRRDRGFVSRRLVLCLAHRPKPCPKRGQKEWRHGRRRWFP